MKKSEIKVGDIFRAKVSGKLTDVRIDAIRLVHSVGSLRAGTRYECTNLATGRSCTFASAAGFRSRVMLVPEAPTPALIVSMSPPPVTEPAPTPTLAQRMAAIRSERREPVTTKSAPHVIVIARAGTGKTTTLVEGLKVMRGESPTITPSPQQKAVWDAMAQSRGASSVGFVAFNSSIAAELQRRVPAGVDARTMHSFGFRAVRNAFGNCGPKDYATADILLRLLDVDPKAARRDKTLSAILKASTELVEKVKANLADTTDDTLMELADAYDIELDSSSIADRTFHLVREALVVSREPQNGVISFSDMIWLPVIHELKVQKYDLLLVDEAQDLNRCQQALALMAGRRLILCGDDRQAIYGFAGADSQSLKRMEETLKDRPDTTGCIVLPLTVTRRCGKAIVEEARKFVPDFEAHESNPPGEIRTAFYGGNSEKIGKTYRAECRDGDFIVCRTNAPIISQAFKFLREGRKATVQGRDIGAGLARVIKLCCRSAEPYMVKTADLIERLGEWRTREIDKEMSKRHPNESKVAGIDDRYECIACLSEGCDNAHSVLVRIESIFTDDQQAPGVRLSSIHKAKGLEAERVYYLRPAKGFTPRMGANGNAAREEENLRYVAITRAIKTLVYVDEQKAPGESGGGDE